MANDPSYVRLVNRMTGGIQADLVSGWSISGYDVRQFPDEEEEPQAAEYVRSKLRAGVLEPSSKAEWEEVHENELEEEMLAQDPDFLRNSGIQEARLQKAARKGTKRIAARRNGSSDADYEADLERRRQTLEAQEEQENKKKGKTSSSSSKTAEKV